MIIGARGGNGGIGAVYGYERKPNTLMWSYQAKLVPNPLEKPATEFGLSFDLHDTTVVVGASSDDGEVVKDSLENEIPRVQVGCCYVFQGSGGQWSQQQRLLAQDMKDVSKGAYLELYNVYLYPRYLGRSVAVNDYGFALGVYQEYPMEQNIESVYIYGGPNGLSSPRWSLQQKLFVGNDSTKEVYGLQKVYMDHENTLITLTSPNANFTWGGQNIPFNKMYPNATTSYVFKTFGNGWSMQQKLVTHNHSSTTSDGATRTPYTNFSNPNLFGGTLLYSDDREIQIRTLFRNDSCLRIWLSDHFLDGWDTAVLTVRAPDLTNDTFHPHCDQRDPFYIRYCPYSATDEGVYIIKVFAATKARFFWEVSWRVMIEATGQWFRGDYSTKMQFLYNKTSASFSMWSSENLIDLNASCHRCTAVTSDSWLQAQETGNSAFWPLTVTGAPYYISDYSARRVYFSGKVCYGVNSYLCYQALKDGVYILRLGGGLFGRDTGFPYANASWSGCGESGTDRDQFVFRIGNGVCTPLQKYRYADRCDQPPPIDTAQYSKTRAPTYGGTVAPSQSTFGNPYQKYQMYSIDIPDDATPTDVNTLTLDDKYEVDITPMSEIRSQSSPKQQDKWKELKQSSDFFQKKKKND